MTARRGARLVSLGMVCAAGADRDAVHERLRAGSPLPEFTDSALASGRLVPYGMVTGSLPEIPARLQKYSSRNAQLLVAAYQQIAQSVEEAARECGRERVAVVLGSSTSGIEEGTKAVAHARKTGAMPAGYHLCQQDLGSPALFLAAFADLHGVAYTISSACSSSAKAIACARGLIELGLCDAVICGGGDSYATLTSNGFDALGLVSDHRCNPSSIHRDGLNLGEGAALFLMRAQNGGIQLRGVGESCDATHFSAPDPEGAGAVACIQLALADAGLLPAEIDYINLHGTATRQNDAMESRALVEVFGEGRVPPASSTKPLTGHTLGGAGAIEAGICWLTLATQEARLPVHRYDGEIDPELPSIPLVDEGQTAVVSTVMSNSFGFGGSNCALIMEGAS